MQVQLRAGLNVCVCLLRKSAVVLAFGMNELSKKVHDDGACSYRVDLQLMSILRKYG